MAYYDEQFQEESAYLEKVQNFLKDELIKSDGHIEKQKKALVDIRKEMWLEGSRSSDDLERAAELNQYVTLEAIETSKYKHRKEQLHTYEKMQQKPYFGRFDFTEEGELKERIYVGYHNAMNDETYEVLVYDWRAPISSIFYRSELGKASYRAPGGTMHGEVSLKRQYEIQGGHLQYFFDCNVTITDEILHQALGKNASNHMKNIVESIQKEQDQIIRDRENDLLIVQGVAGSGKTSIAMHRVAYLLYDRLEEGLNHNNIVIISPNQLFAEYIANVLPELGEKNVSHLTMEEIVSTYFGKQLRMYNRNRQIEYIISSKNRDQVRRTIAFKGSEVFVTLLDRLVDYYETKLIAFKDMYYDGELLETKEALRKGFLNNAIGMPIGKRLNRIEKRLLTKVEHLEKEKREEVYRRVQEEGGQEFEEERAVARILGDYKQNVIHTMKAFTYVDIMRLYRRLFSDHKLLEKLAEGLDLPPNMKSLASYTLKSLGSEWIPYEDGMALLYLKLKIEGTTHFGQIRQVVIDEAQDYYPLQYHVLARLFKGAQYTVLGDIGQTIEKQEKMDLYDQIIQIIQPKHALTLSLNKSYRSSYEINAFSKALRDVDDGGIAFERHDEAPKLMTYDTKEQMYEAMVKCLETYEREGYETIAILTKTAREARGLYEALQHLVTLRMLTEEDVVLEKGIVVLPIYMAKGLEFDGVLVADVNAKAYHHGFDKQLLYIASTRALHRLNFFATEEVTPLLKF
ncbi:MAG: HelD family protein [Cellulosilyticaceae bacterium]